MSEQPGVPSRTGKPLIPGLWRSCSKRTVPGCTGGSETRTRVFYAAGLLCNRTGADGLRQAHPESGMSGRWRRGSSETLHFKKGETTFEKGKRRGVIVLEALK